MEQDRKNLLTAVIEAIKAPIVGVVNGFVSAVKSIRAALPSSGGAAGLLAMALLVVAVLIGLKISSSLVF